jgi:hypothetical protein
LIFRLKRNITPLAFTVVAAESRSAASKWLSSPFPQP